MIPDSLYIDPEKRFAVGYIESKQPQHVLCDDWVGVNPTMILRVVYSLEEYDEKIAILEEGLDDVAIARIKFFLAYVIRPELANRYNKIRFIKRVRVPEWVDEAVMGSGVFAVQVGNDGTMMHLHLPMGLYYEHVLACSIDNRLKLRGGYVASNVSDEWMRTAMFTDTGMQMPYFREYDIEDSDFSITAVTFRKTAITPKLQLFGLYNTKNQITYSTPLFSSIDPLDNSSSNFMAMHNGSPLVINDYGGYFDVFLRHLPPEPVIDERDYRHRVADWTFKGIKFYYRDTDIKNCPPDLFQIGDYIRSGIFLDSTENVGCPPDGTTYRFLIMSAHAVPLSQIKGLSEFNPETALWSMNMFHYNDIFRVMDIYRLGGITQITLLHLPHSAKYLLNGKADFDFLNSIARNYPDFDGQSIIDKARTIFNEKLNQDIHPVSLNRQWAERTYNLPGFDENLRKIELEPFTSVAKPISEFESTITRSFPPPPDVVPKFRIEARRPGDNNGLSFSSDFFF